MNWKSISEELKGKVLFDQHLCKYTSFKIGGKVPIFVEEKTSKSLIEDLYFLRKNAIPYKILGNATNLLVADKDLQFVVLKISTKEILFDDNIVYVDSGIMGFELIQNSKLHSLGGLEFMAGIPGTIGGMVKMNAGAFGNEIGNFVKAIMLSDGSWVDNILFSYRTTNIDDVIIKVKLVLDFKSLQNIQNEIDRILKIRSKTQPHLPSAGSIFKKPRPDFYVGKAIDDLGLKGYKVGGAMISMTHAGFIVNVGGASFDDVIKLIDIIKEKIFKFYGETLELEINIWR